MAVFGMPAVHEDDALRALRAAVEMRDAIVELGIEGRIGLESGEVVVGTAERLVTGRAVTTAARLEQAAQPGEILVGEGTMQLARDAVTAEPLEPLVLKGKPEPVPAWRLVSVSAESSCSATSTRRSSAASTSCESLTEVWDRGCARAALRARDGRRRSRRRQVAPRRRARCRTVDATVAHGRCLSYGAGITYWPVVEVLTQLQPELAELDAGDRRPAARAARRRRAPSSTDELAWAFRKFVEAVSREKPLVLVFDDIHWGEEALLDLIEHVAFVSSGAPILLALHGPPGAARAATGLARARAAARAAHARQTRAADPRPTRRP